MPPQTTAVYDGLSSLRASSSQAYADTYGAVIPQTGPFAAVDGDLDTRWLSSPATDPRQQWIEMRFDRRRAVHEVRVLAVTDDRALVPVRELEVTAGDSDATGAGQPVGRHGHRNGSRR